MFKQHVDGEVKERKHHVSLDLNAIEECLQFRCQTIDLHLVGEFVNLDRVPNITSPEISLTAVHKSDENLNNNDLCA